MPRQARLQRTTRYVALSRGVRKRWMARGSIALDGVTYTPQQILDELKQLIEMNDATTRARAAWLAQAARQRAFELGRRSFLEAVGTQVRLDYGDDAKARSDFGLEPVKKPGPKTAAVKAAAAEKGKATRARRGTMGKRQRKKVKAE